MSESETCTNCNKPKKGKGLSLSQWVIEQDVCVCDFLKTDLERTQVILCNHCKKPLPHYVGGTLTQWIVHPERCSCEAGPLLDLEISNLPAPEDINDPKKTFKLLEGEYLNEEFTETIGLDTERYTVLGVIDSSLSGIFKCLDKSLNRRVAIKMLLHNTWDDKKLVQFQQEAKITAKLNHPNIVEIYDFGITEGQKPYMVIECLDGISLKDHILNNGALFWQKSISIFEQICLGLDHAHRLKLIHGDLKPDNVLLINDNQNDFKIKIIDFGISRLLEQGQSLSESEPLDTQTDIYSLGCLMYETLTGTSSFHGKTDFETDQRHIKDQMPQFPDSLSIPSALVSLVTDCLAKGREQRPDSANSIREELLKITDDRLISSDEKEEDSNKKGNYKIALALICSLVLFSIFATVNKKEEKKPINKELIENHWSGFKVNIKEDSQLPFTYSCSGPVKGTDLIEFKNWYPLAQGLDLSSAELERDNLHYLEGARLRYLNLDNKDIKDKHLAQLGGLKGLEVLSLRNCKSITGEGIKQLTKLFYLNTLDLSGCNLDRDALKQLGKIRSLKILNLANTSFSVKELAKNLNDINLDFLGISKVDFKDSELIKLAGSISSKGLDIRDCKGFTCDSLSNLKTTKALNKLVLTERQGDKSFYKSLSSLDNLKTIELSKATLKDSSPLKKMKNVRTLIFANCANINSTDTSSLGEMKNLKRISFINASLPDETFKAVGKLDSLRSLSLKEAKFTDNGIVHLNKLRLDSLDLSELELNQSTLNNISSVLKTNILNLSKCRIDKPDHLKPLSKMKDLESLNIEQFGDNKEFYDAIGSLTNLKKLTLKNSTILKAKSLALLKNLNSLTISDSKLKTTELNKLRVIPNLKELVLERCQFDSSIVKALEELRLSSLKLKLVSPIDKKDIYGLGNLKDLKSLELFGFNLKPEDIQELNNKIKNKDLLIKHKVSFDKYILDRISQKPHSVSQ